ncbi:hypothetical protein AB0A95_30460 [Micromonospora sp. NPDC049230]|uniref:hypothetical protein n=1 Tax=Micromonospora sp. NPDC049230 TaxID=3155502 RepID=UPI0033F94F84
MHPHTTTALAERPSPELDLFAAAMRSVLRTRHDSPGTGPEALEEHTLVGGFVWRWTTDAGTWRVTAGEVADPRPLLHGPGGVWRVDARPEDATELVLVLLRAAGALPTEDLPLAPVHTINVRPGGATIGGRHFTVPVHQEPRRAVLLTLSDPAPMLPEGYVAVRATADEPDEQGRWDVVMPDGYHHHTYDPAARCLVPYQTSDDGTELLLFEPGQQPHLGYPSVCSPADLVPNVSRAVA